MLTHPLALASAAVVLQRCAPGKYTSVEPLVEGRAEAAQECIDCLPGRFRTQVGGSLLPNTR